jgi:hypothetical protein
MGAVAPLRCTPRRKGTTLEGRPLVNCHPERSPAFLFFRRCLTARDGERDLLCLFLQE